MPDSLFDVPDADIFDEPLVCIQLNKDWSNILSGTLQEFANPTNWNLSTPALKTKFRASVEVLEALFAAQDVLCMPCISFRNHPLSVGCVQVSCDNGETWQDAFCGVNLGAGALHDYDALGHAIISVDGGLTWQNNDANDVRFSSPMPPGHIGTFPACRSAENITSMTRGLTEQIAHILVEGGALLALVAGIAAFFGNLLGFPVPPALVIALVNTITGLSAAVWEQVMNDDIFFQFHCIVFCALGGENAITPIRFNPSIYDTILLHVMNEFDLIPRVFFEAWVRLAGPVGLQVGSVLGIGAGESCGNCDCSPCLPESYNWYDTVNTDLADWVVCDEGEIDPNVWMGNSGAWMATYSDFGAHSYLIDNGYNYNTNFGMQKDVDTTGCPVTRVTVSMYTLASTHTSGFLVLAYRAGVWTLEGADYSWTAIGSWQTRSLSFVSNSATKIALLVLSWGGARVGIVNIDYP